MQRIQFSVSEVIRWLALAVLCFGIATLGYELIFYQFTRWGRLVCPETWWRSSPGLCAFPPVSIAIWSISYAAVSMLLLCAAMLLAPSHKLRVCSALLIALMFWQAKTVIFGSPSWVALGSLSAVVGIATCFGLGALAVHTNSRQRSYPKLVAGQ